MQFTIIDFEKVCITWYRSALAKDEARLEQIKSYLIKDLNSPLNLLTAYQAGIRIGIESEIKSKARLSLCDLSEALVKV